MSLRAKGLRDKAGCSSCHEVNGRGGVVAPDLSAAEKSSAHHLRQVIVHPDAAMYLRRPISLGS
jgi:Cytochrome c